MPPPVVSSISVPLSGVVDLGPDSVAVGGYVLVNSTMVVDPDDGSSAVALSFDFTNVTGKGTRSGTFYTTGGSASEMLRPLRASDAIPLTFPLFPSRGGGMLSARSALASFSLTFDVATGKVTGGRALASTPSF